MPPPSGQTPMAPSHGAGSVDADAPGAEKAPRGAAPRLRAKGGPPPSPLPQGEGRTDNRMAARPMAGAPCRLCGDAKAPRVTTPWCQPWLCGATAFVSCRGGGRCQGEQERLRLCYAHAEDRHAGPWESCQPCRECWSPRAARFDTEPPMNWPRYCGMGGRACGPNHAHQKCS